ncbi:MAG: exo-alpha-sialidase [Thermoguttaceae bacterium]
MHTVWNRVLAAILFGTVAVSAAAANPPTLWDPEQPLPNSADIPVLEGVEFRVIKPYEFETDGYRFLHGVTLAWHKGRLYASFGHNRHPENLAGEEARGRVSDDGGTTWSDIFTIESGDVDGPSGVSHGVFLSDAGTLWAFHGAFGKSIQDNCHTRGYVLDDETGKWQPKGVVVGGGFFPLQEPQKMDDGNWIMGGARVGRGNPPAVAISRGDDFTRWNLVVLPHEAPGRLWGESSVIVAGRRIVNIARYGEQPRALAAASDDYGRTWTPSQPSNLPMAASKPYTGTLSTGQHYLICTTTADSGNRRQPLTIAVTRPGELVFSRVFVIRHAQFPEGPGESHPNAALAYPYAIEHEGKLYVGYSNSGGGAGRAGEGRELWNNNSAEMAIIPVEALEWDVK